MFFAARELELAQRRDALKARSAALRERAIDDVQVLKPALRTADGIVAVWRWVRQHPEMLVAGVVVIAIVRPRGIWVLVRLTWRGWQAWRWVRAIVVQPQA